MNGSIFVNDIIDLRQDEDGLEQNSSQREALSLRTPELSGYIAP
jgi:hypothetical protein